MNLDLKFWSCYLDYPTAEKLVDCYRKNLVEYQEPVSDFFLWILAMKQVTSPGVSRESLAEDIQQQNYEQPDKSNTVTELKQIICKNLCRHVAVRIVEQNVPLEEEILVVESEEVLVDEACFEDWELAFIKDNPEILCSKTALRGLRPYRPFRYDAKSFPYTLTFLVRYDSVEKHVKLRGRIYLKCWQTFPCYARPICQTLHNLLFELKSTHLPQIPTEILDKNANLLTVRAGASLRFPVLCSLDFFKHRDYKRSYISDFPSVLWKLNSYISFSPDQNIKEFLRTREMIHVGDWLCHRICPLENQVFCPYSGGMDSVKIINTIDETHAVKGGVFYGDVMSGKTYYLLKYILSSLHPNTVGQTCYVIQIYDRNVVRKAVEKYDKLKLSHILLDTNDFQKLDEATFASKKLIIVNAGFLARSVALRNRLLKHKLHRLVLDQFEMVDTNSKIAEFFKTVPTNIIWLLTSRMSSDMVTDIYNYLRLNKYFPQSVLTRDFSLMSYALFRQLTFRMVYGNNPLLKIDRNMPLLSSEEKKQMNPVAFSRIELPRRIHHNQYPFEQITVAVRETICKGSLKQSQDLLTLLSALDAGVSMRKREVDDMLLFYSFNVRVGGGVYVYVPPLVDIPLFTEQSFVLDVCPICRETMEDPVKNIACFHIFCYNCLQEWNRVNSSCPCCRQSFRPEFFRLPEQPPTDDIYRILGKRREREDESRQRDDEKREEFVVSDELYFNSGRIQSLQNILRQELFDKVLVITHWRQNLFLYYEAIQTVLNKLDKVSENSKSQIGVLSKKVSYTASDRIDHLVKNSRVILTHSDNINYFRNDTRFQQVIFMDNDASTDAIEYWYNCFCSAVSRIYHFTEFSLDKMYMRYFDALLRNPQRPPGNVTFPKSNAREILIKYRDFLMT